MARDLAPEVERLLQFRDPNIRKKKCTEGLVKTLRGIANCCVFWAKGDAEASDRMNDILAQVASKTESNKNAGNGILYECIQTIMSIEENGGLRVLAINILGKLLSNRDNNIRYIALNMLMRALTVDSKAVQRHRVTILECVKDSDASIQKMALEFIYLLVNENNVKPLAKELIEYLETCLFICVLTLLFPCLTRFVPEKIWYIDQMLKVLSEAGNYVKEDVWHALIVVITNAPDLHGYTVRALYRALHTSSEQENLVRVAIWCIGEYADLLVNNNGMLELDEQITVTESDAVDVVETASLLLSIIHQMSQLRPWHSLLC
ncbi:AP-1 complex subunit gamma-2 [Raphanus sativus]|nr:AP-1 complex subunit gamma-2 [Raphanus sativus]